MKKKESKLNKKLFIIVGSIVGILLIILIVNTIIHWNDCCSCCEMVEPITCIDMCCPCEGSTNPDDCCSCCTKQYDACPRGCCKCEGAILKW